MNRLIWVVVGLEVHDGAWDNWGIDRRDAGDNVLATREYHEFVIPLIIDTQLPKYTASCLLVQSTELHPVTSRFSPYTVTANTNHFVPAI